MEQRTHTAKKKVKKITIQGAAIFCVLCFAIGYIAASVVSSSFNSVDALKSQIAEKEAQIRDLSAAVSAKEAEAAITGKKIAELDTTREKLEAQVAQLEADINNVAGMAVDGTQSGAGSSKPANANTSEWMRWLIVACLATVFIISLMFAIALFFKKGDAEDEAPDKQPKRTKKHAAKKSVSEEALQYLLEGTLDEKLEKLGGFAFGVTATEEGARSFGNTPDGAFAAFTEQDGKVLTVIPRRLHFLVSELSQLGVNDLFRVRSSTEDGLGDGEIVIENVVYTAQFELGDDGWAMAARGDIYAKAIDTIIAPTEESEAAEEIPEEAQEAAEPQAEEAAVTETEE